MKSVRLGDDLEAQLQRASQAAHVSESAIIRRAVANECAQILGNTVYDQIRDLVGSVNGPGGSSTMTDAQIADELAADMARNRRVLKPRS